MSEKISFFSKLKYLFIGFVLLVMIGIAIGLLITVILDTREAEAQTLKEVEEVSPEKIQEEESDETDIETPYEEVSDVKEVESSISETAEPSRSVTPDEILLVGEDIPSGIYKLIADAPTAFYRISASSQPDFIEIKDNDVFSNFTYVKIENGEYLTLVDAKAIPLEEAPVTSFENVSTHKNAKYLVGKDISAGTYTVYPDKIHGYIEVSNSPISSPSNTVLSNYFSSPVSVSLSNGQFFKISQSKISVNQ